MNQKIVPKTKKQKLLEYVLEENTTWVFLL